MHILCDVDIVVCFRDVKVYCLGQPIIVIHHRSQLYACTVKIHYRPLTIYVGEGNNDLEPESTDRYRDIASPQVYRKLTALT